MATTLRDLPNAEVLLAQRPEDLAPIVLRTVLLNKSGNGHLNVASASGQIFNTNDPAVDQRFPWQSRDQVERAIGEAWHWMIRTGILNPAPGINGHNGWMVLTRDGEELLHRPEGFSQFTQASTIPKTMFHPSIADTVWPALVRGELDAAVSAALKEVEISVRRAGEYSDNDVGVKLMRKAFNKTTGKLTDLSLPEGEREAMAELFAGAIGTYKNPQSHRHVRMSNAQEAQEITILASHLLRIVDSRRP